MSYCGSVCNVPCVPYCGGVGSVGPCSLVPVCGAGSVAGVSGFGGLSGLGSGLGYGGGVACSSQLAGSEVVIQPPPSVVTIPGPVLSATNEPVAVGQITPCSYGYPALGTSGGYTTRSLTGGYGGRLGYGAGYCGGYGGYGYGGWRRYSRKCLPSYCGPC